ncbi:fluoride efflux transporter CrcB [Luethyella okanaganae]|uniref:Fluoride-specific ion channel FluC n=1 Tax=Luethyella okanaganae TaxID=69372 RepID=A0ABW1VD81_9MICO
MNGWLVVAVLACGSLAAVARYLLARAFPVRARHLPWGVLSVNLLGSAVGGGVLGLAERAALSPEWRLVLLTGLCGGLTTFSTWTVETIELVASGRWRAALLNAGLTLTLGIIVTATAYLIAR